MGVDVHEVGHRRAVPDVDPTPIVQEHVTVDHDVVPDAQIVSERDPHVGEGLEVRPAALEDVSGEDAPEVYAELHLAVGGLATSSELLRAAADIVELSEPSRQEKPRFRLHVGGLPFEQWPLDVAMADGGWRVMSHEREVIRSLYDEERDAVSDQIEIEHWMMEHAA